MKNSFVFILSNHDCFSITGAQRVNINDSSQLHYTFWHPRVGGGRKQMYKTPQSFATEALDLLYLSLAVFYVDKKVNRKVQDDAWTRNLEVYLPVKEYQKWESCKQIITDALNYLTGDHWSLHFRERTDLTEDEYRYKKGRYTYRNSVEWINTDTFCMLSGGLDSFIGAINLLCEDKNPVFVGNYNGGKGVKNYQDEVVKSLISKFKVSENNFFRFYAAPVSSLEDSTRSRSLMFFAHAITVASGMGHHVDLFIPENGVISLNIPLTVMRLGSLSTRTTHPYFMGLLQKIITQLGIDVTLKNPFQFLTKGEMMKQCSDKLFLNNNFNKTMSCSHPDQGRWAGDKRPCHCGTCLPCTIRRAAIKAAGLTDNSNYRDPNYLRPEARKHLISYRQGLLENKYPLSAIQMSGPIYDDFQLYAELYEHGIQEMKDFIDTI